MRVNRLIAALILIAYIYYIYEIYVCTEKNRRSTHRRFQGVFVDYLSIVFISEIICSFVMPRVLIYKIFRKESFFIFINAYIYNYLKYKEITQSKHLTCLPVLVCLIF